MAGEGVPQSRVVVAALRMPFIVAKDVRNHLIGRALLRGCADIALGAVTCHRSVTDLHAAVSVLRELVELYW